MIYTVRTGILWRELFTVQGGPWELRRACREHLGRRMGRRLTAKLRYKKIGANSFTVETASGVPLLIAYPRAPDYT